MRIRVTEVGRSLVRALSLVVLLLSTAPTSWAQDHPIVERDENGWVIREIYPDGTIVDFERDANGEIVRRRGSRPDTEPPDAQPEED